MGKRKVPFEVRWDNVVLMETPTGFAFFNVLDKFFAIPKVACLLEFVEVDDKSVVWRSDGPGGRIAYLAKDYSRRAIRFIVGDKNLRHLIKSNLGIDCFDKEEDAVHEVMWGLRNMQDYLVWGEEDHITPQYLLPLCQGFIDFMTKIDIKIPTEAVNKEILVYAGSLQRLEELNKHFCTELREACDKLVPDIGGMIKDNWLYVEVMAKILTPDFNEEWDPSKWFTSDEVLKIEAAAEAAVDDARKKLNYELLAMLHANLVKYRRFPGEREYYLQKLRSYEAKVGGQNRSHREVSEEEVVEPAEGTSGKDEDSADVTGVSEESEAPQTEL